MYEYFLENAVICNERIKNIEMDDKYLKGLLKKDDKPIADSTMHRISKERLILNSWQKAEFNKIIKDNLDKLKDLNDEELSKLCYDTLIHTETEIIMLIENNNIKDVKKFLSTNYNLFNQELNNIQDDYHYCKHELRKLKEIRNYLQYKYNLPDRKINNTSTKEIYKLIITVMNLKIDVLSREMEKNE